VLAIINSEASSENDTWGSYASYVVVYSANVVVTRSFRESHEFRIVYNVVKDIILLKCITIQETKKNRV
jgi:hypothetical protein